MRVTFLGTGSAMPTPDRVQTGLLVEGADPLLVDCGSGVLHRLAGTEVGYEGVSTVLLTHHHLDHVADLLPLLKARWLADEPRLTVVGPAGTEALVTGLLDTHEYLQDRVDLTVREVGARAFEVAGYAVEGYETRHSMTCLAYRFGDGFAFSGDTEAFDGLARFADGVDVLAHDCSFPDGVEAANHPTPTELGETLAGHDLDRIYLTHLYPHAAGREAELREAVAEHVDGEVIVAADGMQVGV
ncbi:MAG: MBL fold metallo-hydrolase [Haloferacaceae archaeon]